MVDRYRFGAVAERAWPTAAIPKRLILQRIGEMTMAKITSRDSDPSDPMYSEGVQSYSPHWARVFLPSKTPSPKKKAGHPTQERASGNATQPTSHSKKT